VRGKQEASQLSASPASPERIRNEKMLKPVPIRTIVGFHRSSSASGCMRTPNDVIRLRADNHLSHSLIRENLFAQESHLSE